MEKPAKVKVAVVRSVNRRGAVAEALSLIREELLLRVSPHALILPHLSARSGSRHSTHLDVIAATVDALLGNGSERITVASAPPAPGANARERFEDLGYIGETWRRPVSFETIDAETRKSALEAGCRISLTVPETGGFVGGLGLANLVLSLIPAEHTFPARARNRSLISGILSRLLPASVHRIEAERLALTCLRALPPTFSLVDTFPASRRSGPNRGRWATPGLVIAGADPVAVDAVAASLLGFGRAARRFLVDAAELGLGVADLDRIEIIGDRSTRTGRSSGHLLRTHWRDRQKWAARARVLSR